MTGCEHCLNNLEMRADTNSVTAVLTEGEMVIHSTRGYVPMGRIAMRYCPACGTVLNALKIASALKSVEKTLGERGLL